MTQAAAARRAVTSRARPRRTLRTLRVHLRGDYEGFWIDVTLDRARLRRARALSPSAGLAAVGIASNFVDADGEAIDVTREADCGRLPIGIWPQLVAGVDDTVAFWESRIGRPT